MLYTLFVVLLTVLSVFMILLILIQRGKGGGLAGAFGGMGGQSAFGTKAGDTFTKITVVTAIIWFILCGSVVWYLKHGSAGGIGGSFGEGIRTTSTGSADSPASISIPDVTSSETSVPATETTAPAPVPTESAPSDHKAE